MNDVANTLYISKIMLKLFTSSKFHEFSHMSEIKWICIYILMRLQCQDTTFYATFFYPDKADKS